MYMAAERRKTPLAHELRNQPAEEESETATNGSDDRDPFYAGKAKPAARHGAGTVKTCVRGIIVGELGLLAFLISITVLLVEVT